MEFENMPLKKKYFYQDISSGEFSECALEKMYKFLLNVSGINKSTN